MKKVKQIIEQAVGGEIEHPADEGHGDYSSNIAMAMFADSSTSLGMTRKADMSFRPSPLSFRPSPLSFRPSPLSFRPKWRNLWSGNFADSSTSLGMTSARGVAERIKGRLEDDEKLMKVVEKIEVKGPGFINFWLKKEWLLKELERVVKKGKEYGKGSWGKGRRMVIDYSSPNIAKQFSVGHLRSTIIGQAIYNLYKASGWRCVGDNHLGDWGTQFGMIIAAVEKWNLNLSEMNVNKIEKVYVRYNQLAKEDEKYLVKAQQAFARLEKGETKAKKIWQEAVKMSMKDFDKVYELLGVKIDEAYGESFYEEEMLKVIKEMKKSGAATVGEKGALIVELPDLPPAMLVKSDGASTYFTRDMATVKYRLENPNLMADLYVYEVGAEQSLHFKQVFAATEKMGWGKRENFVHVAHGLVLGEDGKKMSTRKGTTESMEKLLLKMIQRAAKINKDSARQVGVGAVIFNDLKHSPQTSYRFDWKKALALEGDSGPYVQYACVRARRVVDKANACIRHVERGLREIRSTSLRSAQDDMGGDGMEVLRRLYRFGEVVERAAKEFAPNLLCEYLLDLARSFNGFYAGEKIAGSLTRLLITAATAQVLENGLRLLHIEVPEKM